MGQGRLNTNDNFRPKKIWAKPKRGRGGRGCGGNFASPEPKRNPAALLAPLESLQCKLSNGARSEQNPAKKFFFLLPARIATQSVAGGEEKIGRAQNQNRNENFFAGWRASASGGGAERQFRSKWVRAFSNKGHQIGAPERSRTPVISLGVRSSIR